jgi:hypothetical protein
MTKSKGHSKRSEKSYSLIAQLFALSNFALLIQTSGSHGSWPERVTV